MTKTSQNILILSFVIIALSACENRDVNHADGPNFSEIHEDIQYHFDKIEIEGHSYYILERDRNNPHEGFGFMAMRANNTVANQDSIKAYLKTLLDVQKQILAVQNGLTSEEADAKIEELFINNLNQSNTIKRTKEKAEE
ncbi:MAG: hypothetical protein ABJF11_14555 [Reichenbachiella sp.]|uniref:hypothetical protein n=1 Tax=Reichenbachiella sp. TaxID=2184521 RepID=UPI003266C30E